MQWLRYILAMTLLSGLFYGYYRLLLHNRRFHRFNRFYLLGSSVVSLLLPLLPFSIQSSRPDNPIINGLIAIQQVGNATGTQVVNTAVAADQQAHQSVNLLLLFYLLITVFILAQFIRSLIAIGKIIRGSLQENIGGIIICRPARITQTGSFFHYILWNEQVLLDTPAGQSIFLHESVHIAQGHTYDRIWCSLLHALAWFNPFYWLIEKELALIHEFLADETAYPRSGREVYAELLLSQCLHSGRGFIMNSFSQAPLGRRLNHLFASRRSRFGWMARLLVLPLFAIAFCGFGLKYESARIAVFFSNKTPTVRSAILPSQQSHQQNPNTAIPSHRSTIRTKQKVIDQSGNKIAVGDSSKIQEVPKAPVIIDADQYQLNIRTIKEIARNKSQPAYEYEGRTYIFANAEATSFDESNGTHLPILFNGKLIDGVEEINRSITRDQISKIDLLDPPQVQNQYGLTVSGPIMLVESVGYKR